MNTVERRKFLKSALAFSALPLARFSGNEAVAAYASAANNRFKISLNAYSFNAPLTSGQTDLLAVMEFCAAQGFDAVDLTGYYFPGYPQVPPDEYIYRLKRKAHRLGLGISGTGIRNDFTPQDKTVRGNEVERVKQWIEVAAKLGAPVIRIFTGNAAPQTVARDVVAGWMAEDIITCVELGKQHGVIVAVQNHNDFIKTAGEAIDLVKRVNSEWFGLVLDTGSFVTNEPYGEIEKAAPYAVNWQIKEKLNYGGMTQDMDLIKLFQIIQASPYHGYLPIETLSAGDPFGIVPSFLKKVRGAMEKVM